MFEIRGLTRQFKDRCIPKPSHAALRVPPKVAVHTTSASTMASVRLEYLKKSNCVCHATSGAGPLTTSLKWKNSSCSVMSLFAPCATRFAMICTDVEADAESTVEYHCLIRETFRKPRFPKASTVLTTLRKGSSSDLAVSANAALPSQFSLSCVGILKDGIG